MRLASSGPTAAPVSEYKFAEGSGTVANDSGSNNIAGQLIGPGFGYTTTSLVGPYALNLTAANSYLQIPHSAADQLSTYTVSAWVNASSFSSGNPTIFSTRNGGDTTFDVQLLPSGIHGDVGSGTAWLDTNLNLSHPINPGTWYLVTYSVSSAGTNIYLNDGTAATGGATANYTPGAGVYTTGTPALENSSTFATIGNQEGGGNSFAATSQFLGQIDDVRIYNSALTAAQVAQLYALTPAGVTLNSNNATALGSNSQLTVGAGSTSTSRQPASSVAQRHRQRHSRWEHTDDRNRE